jgi:hypothetical protein
LQLLDLLHLHYLTNLLEICLDHSWQLFLTCHPTISTPINVLLYFPKYFVFLPHEYILHDLLQIVLHSGTRAISCRCIGNNIYLLIPIIIIVLIMDKDLWTLYWNTTVLTDTVFTITIIIRSCFEVFLVDLLTYQLQVLGLSGKLYLFQRAGNVGSVVMGMDVADVQAQLLCILRQDWGVGTTRELLVIVDVVIDNLEECIGRVLILLLLLL